MRAGLGPWGLISAFTHLDPTNHTTTLARRHLKTGSITISLPFVGCFLGWTTVEDRHKGSPPGCRIEENPPGMFRYSQFQSIVREGPGLPFISATTRIVVDP